MRGAGIPDGRCRVWALAPIPCRARLSLGAACLPPRGVSKGAEPWAHDVLVCPATRLAAPRAVPPERHARAGHVRV